MSTVSKKPPGKLHFLTGRPRVQTKWVFGDRERFRWTIFAIKYAIFLGLPWISVNGAPALFFDIPRRQYHVFGAVFWPQDFYLLGLFLAIAAVMLFFSTTLVARAWCGFACPQTLLTHLFMVIDHTIEGDRPARLALDVGKSDTNHILRRLLKHGAWIAIAGYLGFTFTSYFVGIHTLINQVSTGTVGWWSMATWAFITTITYLFAGHLRDFVCTTTCPYGRFQGAMQDTNSLLVTYDSVRGEPRGKSKEAIARGACVDCKQCVAACPMGIDIRNGAQYECIACQRCLDACNLTLKMVGEEPNLIRLASLSEMEARAANPNAPWPERGARHWLRPRILWYATVLITLVGTLTTLIITRPLLAINATRDANRVFALSGGRISNFYHLALLNKDTQTHVVNVKPTGIDAQLVGIDRQINLPAGAITTVDVSVVTNHQTTQSQTFAFVLTDASTGKLVNSTQAAMVEPLK